MQDVTRPLAIQSAAAVAAAWRTYTQWEVVAGDTITVFVGGRFICNLFDENSPISSEPADDPGGLSLSRSSTDE